MSLIYVGTGIKRHRGGMNVRRDSPKLDLWKKNLLLGVLIVREYRGYCLGIERPMDR